MDALIEFLKEKLGANAVGLAVVFVAGAVLFYYSTSFFVTSSRLEESCVSIAAEITKGDSSNLYQILSLQIESLQREKMQVRSFVIVNQNGQYNDEQRRQMEELDGKIKKLEMRREEVIRKLSGH